MIEFVDAALGFPAVIFGFLLLVVIGYWLLVLAGGADADALEGDPGTAGGFAGALATLGFGGIPPMIALSVVVLVAWFVSLVGTVLTASITGLLGFLAGLAALLAALACAWAVTRLLAPPLRRLLPADNGPSRTDFVGRPCVIRTGRVTPDFGQAEVTSDDGSSAIVQVRQPGTEAFSAGSKALIFDYDADGEFFWVTPLDPVLDAGLPPHGQR
ncbi:hypothetical protein AB0M43_11295 [Longispora sp. NPDC051575]|uniref:hypothetical protein n=1 Tax=Longispora sp. NPDC051575 TaxID=3154943 RepID=UPI003438149B